MATRWLALVVILAGCAELGVVSYATSISVGRASRGYLLEGARLPDSGEGLTTRDVWRARDNRYGTDELVDLLVGVSRRMQRQVPEVRLVVADLSGVGGGERRAFHRSHQTGRDVDLLYYMRDAAGQPFEPDAMHTFNRWARSTDGSRVMIDVPRTWLLIKELLTAPEAAVQWIFMYQPIAERLIDYAEQSGEPPELIARARRTVKQPSDSARHDDHLHVRVYCATADRGYGCVDTGPMEMLADHASEPSPVDALMAALTTAAPSGGALASADPAAAAPAPAAPSDARGPADRGGVPSAIRGAAPATVGPLDAASVPAGLGRLLRTRVDHLSLRGWR